MEIRGCGLKHQKEKHGLFCGTGRFGQGHERQHCGWHGQDRSGSEGGERTGSSADSTEGLWYRFKRIGLEAGPLSQWLRSALAEADLPVICVETRHMRAVLKAQINKTDRPLQFNGQIAETKCVHESPPVRGYSQ
jgi:hypothetical protein